MFFFLAVVGCLHCNLPLLTVFSLFCRTSLGWSLTTFALSLKTAMKYSPSFTGRSFKSSSKCSLQRCRSADFLCCSSASVSEAVLGGTLWNGTFAVCLFLFNDPCFLPRGSPLPLSTSLCWTQPWGLNSAAQSLAFCHWRKLVVVWVKVVRMQSAFRPTLLLIWNAADEWCRRVLCTFVTLEGLKMF